MRNLRIVLVISVILAIGVTAYFNKPVRVTRVNLEGWKTSFGSVQQTLDKTPSLLDKYFKLLDNDLSLTVEEKISMVEKNILAELNCDN